MLSPRLLALTLAAVLTGNAATVSYSPPVGGMTLSVPAGQTRSFTLPLLHESIGTGKMRGQITSVGSNYIEVADANWEPGNLSNSANPYYLHIRSGSAAGRMLVVSSTPNTSSRLYVGTDGRNIDSADGVLPGDDYEIILADTLGSLFGADTLQGGPTANQADNVWFWGSTTWLKYYYNTDRGRWERSTDTSASNSRDNLVVRPDRGFMIVRNSLTPLTMRVTGRVSPIGGLYAHNRPGATFLSTGMAKSITLGELSLHTRALSWLTGTSPGTATTQADFLQIWASTAWLNYYFDTNKGYWRRTTDSELSASRNNISISAGTPVMVVRQASANGESPLLKMPDPPAF